MMSEPKTDTDCPLFCPHCGEESTNDDDLCRFCGKVMIATVAQKGGCVSVLIAVIRYLKTKVRPLTAEEFDELFNKTTFNLSNPADPIWDDWHWEP